METDQGLTLDQLAITAPALVGAISSWIVTTSIKPQPSLALAAALSVVAACKSHVVRAPSGLRTNLFLCGVAPSGSGKNHPMECVKRILKSIKQTGLLSGKPGSGAALTELVAENSGKRLVLWDEFGYGFSGMKDSGNNHERETIPVLLEMFSSANSTFLPKRIIGSYDKPPRPEIDQPCLNVLGFTAPDKLFSSLNLHHAIDGFLARFLFLQVKNREVPARETELQEVPEHIKTQLMSWIELRGQGDIERYLNPTTKARVVGFSPEGKSALALWQNWFEEQKTRDSEDEVAFDALWARALEHTIKIALVVSGDKAIGEEELTWAAQFVATCIMDFIETLKRDCGASEREKQSKKVLNVIVKFGVITQRDLTRRTQFLKHKEREEMLEDLVGSGQIRKEPAGDRANSFVYVLNKDD